MDAWTWVIGFGLVVAAFALWAATRGETVGSMRCLLDNQDGSMTRVRIMVRRAGAQKSGLPDVLLQARAIGVMGIANFNEYEARQLADVLDRAVARMRAE